MINSDTLLERLRERVTESDDSYNHGHCDNCNAQLTQADIDNDRTCTNCGSAMESDDEELFDDGDDD